MKRITIILAVALIPIAIIVGLIFIGVIRIPPIYGVDILSLLTNPSSAFPLLIRFAQTDLFKILIFPGFGLAGLISSIRAPEFRASKIFFVALLSV